MPEHKFLGKGIVNGEHIADLWSLGDGLTAAMDPGTNVISRNPDVPDRWKRQECGDWYPV